MALTTNKIILSGTYPNSDITIGKSLTVNETTTLKGGVVVGESTVEGSPNFAATSCVAIGDNVSTDNVTNSCVIGKNAKVKHSNTIIWNGDTTTDEVKTTTTDGSMNLYPRNGVDGIFISGETLGSLLDKRIPKNETRPSVGDDGVGTACKVVYDENGVIVGTSSIIEEDLPIELTTEIHTNKTNIDNLTTRVDNMGRPLRFIGIAFNKIDDGVPVSEIQIVDNSSENEYKTVELDDGDVAIWQDEEHIYSNGVFHTFGSESHYIPRGGVENSDVPDNTLSISKVSNLQSTLDSKVNKNDDITAGTKCKITYDSKGLITGGENLTVGDLPDGIPQNKISGLSTDIANKVSKDTNAKQVNNYCKITTNADGLVIGGSDKINIDDVTNLGTQLSTITTNINGVNTSLNSKVNTNVLSSNTAIDLASITSKQKDNLIIALATALGQSFNYSINAMSVTLSQNEFVYTGSEQKPTIVNIGNDDISLTPSDYSLSYANNINAGNASVLINAKGTYYIGSIDKTFTIKPFNGQTNSGNRLSISTNVDSLVYNGQPIPDVIINIIDTLRGTVSLVENVDFDYQIVATGTPLTYKLQLQYKGNYSNNTGVTWFDFATFTVEKYDINGATANYSNTVQYDGSATYEPTVTLSTSFKNPLTKNTDYTVSYSNNTSVTNDAVISCSGIGNFKGTINLKFSITPYDMANCVVNAIANQTLVDGVAEPDVVIVNDKSNTLVKGVDYTLSYTNNTAVGTATAIATGIGNYTGTISKTFEIVG